jgi:hypothetical protein
VTTFFLELSLFLFFFLKYCSSLDYLNFSKQIASFIDPSYSFIKLFTG